MVSHDGQQTYGWTGHSFIHGDGQSDILLRVAYRWLGGDGQSDGWVVFSYRHLDGDGQSDRLMTDGWVKGWMHSQMHRQMIRWDGRG